MFLFVGRLLVDKGLRELVATARLLKEEGATVRLRDALIAGETGFLCEPRDVASLADAMRRMTALAPAAREAMGRKGRAVHGAIFFGRDCAIRLYRDLIRYGSFKAPAC